eukprot:6474394-Amphidinium_carterae.3
MPQHHRLNCTSIARNGRGTDTNPAAVSSANTYDMKGECRSDSFAMLAMAWTPQLLAFVMQTASRCNRCSSDLTVSGRSDRSLNTQCGRPSA